MKVKVLVSVLALALVVGGCCTRIDPTTKATTKSFSNCLAAAQQMLCNPTAQQKQEAASVLQFLTSGVQVAGLVVNLPITVAEVTTVFSMVQSGGCVLVTDMQAALDWYDSMTTALQAKQMTSKTLVVTPPAIPQLHAWVK